MAVSFLVVSDVINLISLFYFVFRMAHNPPAVARLDIMDRLGMLAVDENRVYGGSKQQGGITSETISEENRDFADLIARDRSHPSVLTWSYCNEVGCNNETSASFFQAIAREMDPYRPVTQNHLGTNKSTRYLDVQGFSHKSTAVYDSFHKQYPKKPMLATECCSCMSQRGIDQDVCPHPQDGGCVNGPSVSPGTFYNNNIGKCTAQQVIESDSPDYVAGTFVWYVYFSFSLALFWF